MAWTLERKSRKEDVCAPVARMVRSARTSTPAGGDAGIEGGSDEEEGKYLTPSTGIEGADGVDKEQKSRHEALPWMKLTLPLPVVRFRIVEADKAPAITFAIARALSAQPQDQLTYPVSPRSVLPASKKLLPLPRARFDLCFPESYLPSSKTFEISVAPLKGCTSAAKDSAFR